MNRRNLTGKPSVEWANDLIASFSKAAREAEHPDLAYWYARESARIARQFVPGIPVAAQTGIDLFDIRPDSVILGKELAA